MGGSLDFRPPSCVCYISILIRKLEEMIKLQYESPEAVIVATFDLGCPLCASTGELPPMEESDDLGNLGWN